MSNIEISKCTNLIIKIFVIGYSVRGESIVILFLDKANNIVLYTIVIDCFTYQEMNKTIDILQLYQINAINMLCWSHPDCDHTKGIECILEQYCDDNTKIITPYGLNGKEYDVIDYNIEDKSIIDQIIQLNKQKKTHLTSAVAPFSYQPMDSWSFIDYFSEIPIRISTLSPHSSLINSRIATEKTIKKNELAIAMLIEVGRYNFIFCSDIENPAITKIMSSCFKNPLFLKIPHHTSPTSDTLLQILDMTEKQTLGCTTTYQAHNLPNMELLQKYKEECLFVHSTGTSHSSSINHGVIEYTFDLYDECCVDIECEGHAHRV